jgi:uncharacterized protein (TIGR03545 family)
MSRLFRWQGLVAFTTIVALLAVFFYIFAEHLIKTGIEQSAGWSLGAEVNVENVTLTYAPLSIAIDNVQATDVQQPSQNLFSFSKAEVGFELWQYLFGKIIINELTVEGLTFNQKRAAAGEVYLKPIETNNDLVAEDNSLFPALDVSLPDAKTLLADSHLLTVKQAQALKHSYQDESNKLKALKSKLPNKIKLKSYQKRLKALAQVKVNNINDIAQIKTQYHQMKKEFEADKELIKQAKVQIKQTKVLMSKQVKLMKNAPSEDWRSIEQKYQLDQIDVEDFAHLLFGKQAREYYQTAEMIYNKVKPYLDKNKSEKELTKLSEKSSKGRFIYFVEEQTLPSFLVKNAKISMRLAKGDFSLIIKELNYQHWLQGKPTELTFSSQNFNTSGSFFVNSEFSLTKMQQLSAAGKWSLDKLPVENIKFKESAKLNLTLAKGMVGGDGQVVIEDNIISALNNIKLTQASYQGKASSQLGNILIDTFKSMDDLAISINISGALENPDYAITSELDKLLKNAFDQQVKQKITQFKSKIQAGLNDKLKSALKINNEQTSELLDIEGLLTDTDKTIDALLTSDIVKQQEDKLKNKLRNKVEDKLKEKLGQFWGG